MSLTSKFCLLTGTVGLSMLGGTLYSINNVAPKLIIRECFTATLDTTNLTVKGVPGLSGWKFSVIEPEVLEASLTPNMECLSQLTQPIATAGIIGAGVGVALCIALSLHAEIQKKKRLEQAINSHGFFCDSVLYDCDATQTPELDYQMVTP